jgi:3-hydroxyisobutyrate dehydrogenase-like beta-hydroxyacid dehydrogenase
VVSNAKGDLFIETSTISPKLVKKIDQIVKMQGAEFIDAG